MSSASAPRPVPFRVFRSARTGVLVDARDYYGAFYDAAREARRSILLLGWQFDSDVPLLRGGDVPPGIDPRRVELLPFLDGLCAARAGLEVRILAWDYSMWLVLEREVLQKLSFALRTCDRLYFESDATVSQYGAHHQKLAVIDGRVGFLGSADIAHDRWDTSEHAFADARRVSRGGAPCKPYHEVQAVVTGEVARSLVDLFVERWEDATGERLDARALSVDAREPAPLPRQVAVTMPPAEVALITQFSHRLGRAPVRALRDLLVTWIAEAEHLLYIETQYLTSRIVADALLERMRRTDRGRLEIVVVLPRKPEALKEELAVGATQARVLTELVLAAQESGHALGLYDVAARGASAEGAYVYIHAKLLIVDDRRLTIGSANLNNRSMTLDSELNAAWTTGDPADALGEAITALRVRLLREHCGSDLSPDFCAGSGLVDRLDARVRAGASRLRFHDLAVEEPSALMKLGQRIASAYADPLHSPESRETPLPFDGPAPTRHR